MAVLLKTGERKVLRSVHYIDAAGRRWPAFITSLGAGNLVTLRRHGVRDTIAGVALAASINDNSSWYPGTRRRYV